MGFTKPVENVLVHDVYESVIYLQLCPTYSSKRTIGCGYISFQWKFLLSTTDSVPLSAECIKDESLL